MTGPDLKALSRDEAAAHLSDDSIFTIYPSDPMKTSAYAPKDIQYSGTDKPIFFHPHGFTMMFDLFMLVYIFSVLGITSNILPLALWMPLQV